MPSPKPSWLDARDESLRELVRELPPREFYGFEEQMLEACADIVAHANGREVVFVGRSPELLRELLRALFRGVRGAPAFLLLPYSQRREPAAAAARWQAEPALLDALEDHVRDHGTMCRPDRTIQNSTKRQRRGASLMGCNYDRPSNRMV